MCSKNFCPLFVYLFFDQGSNPGPLHSKHSVLATGPPGSPLSRLRVVFPSCFSPPVSPHLSKALVKASSQGRVGNSCAPLPPAGISSAPASSRPPQPLAEHMIVYVWPDMLSPALAQSGRAQLDTQYVWTSPYCIPATLLETLPQPLPRPHWAERGSLQICPDSPVHGISLGKNTGVGCHFLLKGIFPTQELNCDPKDCSLPGLSIHGIL